MRLAARLLFSSGEEEVIKETKAEGADLTEEHTPSLRSAEDLSQRKANFPIRLGFIRQNEMPWWQREKSIVEDGVGEGRNRKEKEKLEMTKGRAAA